MTREEAIGIIKSECYIFDPLNLDRSTMVNTALDMAIIALEKETKTGRWIFVDKAHEHAHRSECGYGNVALFNGRPHNYCPNCGAKMDEDERKLKYADQDTMMPAT